VIIVVDGKFDFSINKNDEFEIIFSEDKSADEVIKNKIDNVKNKKVVRVVSDDREIRYYAKRMGVISLRTSEFIKKDKIKNKNKESKDISYSLQREITEELKKIWLGNYESKK
jgi:hypothetical protein